MKRKRIGKRLGMLALVLALMGALLFGLVGLSQSPLTYAGGTSSSSREEAVSSQGLHSPAAYLVRLKDKKVLLDKNGDQGIYPASLTKIMTVTLALKKLDNLEQWVTIPNGIVSELTRQNASMAGFAGGERVKVIDLLYGALLPSGAECCEAIALYASGSQNAFVKEMNQEARRLGMENTHFTNTTGLPDDEHTATVKDLAKLLRASLKNKTFRKIFTAKRYSVKPTNLHPQGITFTSTLFDSLREEKAGEGKILGGKTGYTAEAGLCLATLAEWKGEDYILITAGAPGSHKTQPFHIQDARTVYQRLFQS